MIDELLRYSMIESIEKTPKCEPVCLNAALEQSLVGFYGAFTASGIIPDVRVSEKRIMAKIDPDAIRRVLDNMPGNARNIRTAIRRLRLKRTARSSLKTPPKSSEERRRKSCSTAFTPFRPQADRPDSGFPSHKRLWSAWAAAFAPNTKTAGCAYAFRIFQNKICVRLVFKVISNFAR